MTHLTARPPEEALRAAIEWMVRLQSGQASPQDHAACERWQHERPEHAQAWATLDAVSQRLKALPTALARRTLAAPQDTLPRPPRRRALLKGVLVLGGGGAVALGVADDGAWQHLTADHHTRVGERRQVALADGSVLHLNTATALDTRLDAQGRCVTLHHGEVMVTCPPDPTFRPARPFVVRTTAGEVHAHAGRFVVQHQARQTKVQALEGGLEVHPRSSPGGAPSRVPLREGERLVFAAGRPGAPVPADEGAAAWIDGLLVARDIPLATLAAELARYRRGWLQCAQAVAGMRISGVFPVDDLDRVVAALQRTLPVRARAITPWWVTLGPR